VKKESRASRFVEFLVDEFGHDFLSSTLTGVLDVAGGAGGVAFELAVRRGIPCTVVDPRPLKLNAKQRRTLAFRRAALDRVGPEWRAISPFARAMSARFAARAPSHCQAWFDDAFCQTEQVLVEGASVLVGMHPDQATDAIVDAAVRMGKPWAVVPCCVFPTQFPHRRTPSGEPVRSYNQLCSYLEAKVAGTRSLTLDAFEGRNRVIFWHPPA
jgi:hypothetical protein